MSGIIEFPTLADAIRAGYEYFDRSEGVIRVRIRTAAGFAFAVIRPGNREAK